jgi:hypothetical protein
MAAWGARQSLRTRYAAHTVSELDQLEAAVEAKECEVAALKKQVEQMTRFLAATRTAATNRRMREARGDSDAAKPVMPTGLAKTLAKTKKKFLSSAGAEVWDVHEGGPVCPKGENVIEEWQHNVIAQSEMAQRMRAHVDEQKKALETQTSHRKAQETALFSSQVASLKLRAEAQQAEARVQRLANELKRVYQAVPDTIKQKIGPAISETREDKKETEIKALRIEHHTEFFKFMECDKIHHESEICQKKLTENDQDITLARQVLNRGRYFADSSVQHTQAAQMALDALHDRWARFVAAGYAAGELTVKDDLGQRSDDADCVMQRATLSVTALTSLIHTLQSGAASLHTDLADMHGHADRADVHGHLDADSLCPTPVDARSMVMEDGSGLVSSLSKRTGLSASPEVMAEDFHKHL